MFPLLCFSRTLLRIIRNGLFLDELWEMLSECLMELARTHDQHAVLVLQPAVEAFFLVHAGEKQEVKKDGDDKKREENQTAHLHLDLPGPMSPAHPSQGAIACFLRSLVNLIQFQVLPCYHVWVSLCFCSG